MCRWLISALKSDRDLDLRVRTSYFLAYLSRDPRAVEALLAALKDNNPIIREGVASNQDFGNNSVKWRNWLEKQSTEGH